MRRCWLLLLLLLSVAAFAQTPQVGATLGLNQTFTGANTFTLGVELGPYTVSQLSTLTGLTNITIVSNGTPGSSPCTGGGTGAVATYYNSQWNCGASGSGGGDTITSPNSTLTVGGSSTATTLDINLAQTNTWTGAQTFGTIKAAGYMSVGTTFTSNAGCTESSLTGGATKGSFLAGATSCTLTITMGNSATSPNGWACSVWDVTTTADTMKQTASTTTTATFSGTVASSDKIIFSCDGF
jgi:hypothetical protein